MSRHWQISLRLEPNVTIAPQKVWPRDPSVHTKKLARVAQLVVHGIARPLESQVREKRSA